MDWNYDGKIDCKDHAFYNNVVGPGMKKTESSSSGKLNNTPKSNSSEHKGIGLGLFIGLCIVYFVIKIIGG
jgi:hypothetical protein